MQLVTIKSPGLAHLSYVVVDGGQAAAQQLQQAIRHLVRLGYTQVGAFVRDGIVAWQTGGHDIGSVPALSARQLADRLDEVTVLDVRKPTEFREGHVRGAVNRPLSTLVDQLDTISRDRPIVTFCGSGRRATIAASILARAGVDHVAVCLGSMAAWQALDLPVAP